MVSLLKKDSWALLRDSDFDGIEQELKIYSLEKYYKGDLNTGCKINFEIYGMESLFKNVTERMKTKLLNLYLMGPHTQTEPKAWDQFLEVGLKTKSLASIKI